MKRDRPNVRVLGYAVLYLAVVIFGISYASTSSNSGSRIGANCSDGWNSGATGQGACSHHGGVARWRYIESQGTDPTSGYLASGIVAVLGGLLVLSGKSEKSKLMLNGSRSMTAIPQKITPRAPVTQEMTVTRPPRVYVSPHIPMTEPNSQKCTCGAWMFKTTNSQGIQILKCARTNECGKWRPLT